MKEQDEWKNVCDDCVHFDDCEYSCEDGAVCDKFSPARYVLTPKGIWYVCCLEEFEDNGNCDWFDEDMCCRFFEKYSNSMYANGLIADSGESRIKRWLKRVKMFFNVRKRKTSVDILLETMKDDEFVGTPLSEEETIKRIYGNFVEAMVRHGHVA